MTTTSLLMLADRIRTSAVFAAKRDIRAAAREFGVDFGDTGILNGDDAAAIPDGDGYLLLAAEGIVSALIAADPCLAGRSAVLANVNDIYAMGGRPLAMVDVISNATEEKASEICRGIRENAARFRVPLVGGHTTCGSGDTALSLAIIGRAKRLITSFDARPGDRLLLVSNPTGTWLDRFGFWNSNACRCDTDLRADLELLPEIAECGLVEAGKDVSMAGIAGTALMLAEASRVGVSIDLDRIKVPDGVELPDWLLAFFSYGFLLSVTPEKLPQVSRHFIDRGLAADEIGSFREGSDLRLASGEGETVVWDWEREQFTGFRKP